MPAQCSGGCILHPCHSCWDTCPEAGLSCAADAIKMVVRFITVLCRHFYSLDLPVMEGSGKECRSKRISCSSMKWGWKGALLLLITINKKRRRSYELSRSGIVRKMIPFSILHFDFFISHVVTSITYWYTDNKITVKHFKYVYLLVNK